MQRVLAEADGIFNENGIIVGQQVSPIMSGIIGTKGDGVGVMETEHIRRRAKRL